MFIIMRSSWDAIYPAFLQSENLLMVSFSLYCLPFSLVISLSVRILYWLPELCRNDSQKRRFIWFCQVPGDISSLESIFNLFVNFLTWDCHISAGGRSPLKPSRSERMVFWFLLAIRKETSFIAMFSAGGEVFLSFFILRVQLFTSPDFQDFHS